MSNFGYGSTGQVLTSNGAGVMPSFQAAGGGGSATGFLAYLFSDLSNVTGNGVTYSMVFDTTTRNDSSIYNTTTGVFTANKSGFWLLSTAAFFNSVSNFSAVNTGANLWFNNNTSSQQYFQYFINPYASQNIDQTSFSIANTSIVLLNSADEVVVDIQVFGGTQNIGFQGAGGVAYFTYFSGVFLGS